MALRFESLVELYQAACSTYGVRPLFGTRRKEGWSWTTYGELRELIDAFRGGLASLKPYEVPRRWVLTTDELTTENGMLTPTLKLRRRKATERYGDELEELYRARAA